MFNSQLVLATYNIHACIGMDRRFDPHRTSKVLGELNADVIALQEVEHHQVGQVDLLEFLATATGSTAIAGPTLQRTTRHYGNALLSRLPVLSYDLIDLSQPGHEPRGAIDAILRCDKQRMRVIATHLGLSPGERRKQTRQLLARLKSQEYEIAVLMGDLNEWFLWGRILRWLHARFEPTPKYATFPACCPILSLDHVWVSPRDRLTKLEVHVSERSRKASDHLPLKGAIRLD